MESVIFKFFLFVISNSPLQDDASTDKLGECSSGMFRIVAIKREREFFAESRRTIPTIDPWAVVMNDTVRAKGRFFTPQHFCHLPA